MSYKIQTQQRVSVKLKKALITLTQLTKFCKILNKEDTNEKYT